MMKVVRRHDYRDCRECGETVLGGFVVETRFDSPFSLCDTCLLKYTNQFNKARRLLMRERKEAEEEARKRARRERRRLGKTETTP